MNNLQPLIEIEFPVHFINILVPNGLLDDDDGSDTDDSEDEGDDDDNENQGEKGGAFSWAG